MFIRVHTCLCTYSRSLNMHYAPRCHQVLCVCMCAWERESVCVCVRLFIHMYYCWNETYSERIYKFPSSPYICRGIATLFSIHFFKVILNVFFCCLYLGASQLIFLLGPVITDTNDGKCDGCADSLQLIKVHSSTHCNTLQHTATHCNTLQHTATHCNTLQHTATHFNTLQHTATHCNTLQHTATHCNTLQHTATHCNGLHYTLVTTDAICDKRNGCADSFQCVKGHTATHCNTVQQVATHYSTLQRTETHSRHHCCNVDDGCADSLPFIKVYTVTHCNTLQHTATHCNTLSTLQHSATPCNTLPSSPI